MTYVTTVTTSITSLHTQLRVAHIFTASLDREQHRLFYGRLLKYFEKPNGMTLSFLGSAALV
jgi:hypothetical protein